MTHQILMEITIEGQSPMPLRIGLLGQVVPKTAANFAGLCRGDQTIDGQALSFVGAPLFRIIPSFMIQTGDFSNKDGTGSHSSLGTRYFDNENFELKHEAYCLSMANRGEGTNGSQFFITTAQTSWLDNAHVVFGTLLDQESIDNAIRLEHLGSPSGEVAKKIVISSCEVLPENKVVKMVKQEEL